MNEIGSNTPSASGHSSWEAGNEHPGLQANHPSWEAGNEHPGLQANHPSWEAGN